MRGKDQNWPITACWLLLTLFIVEYIAFCVIVPQKLVMDIALIASFAFFSVVLLLAKAHDKRTRTGEKEAGVSISTPLMAILTAIGMLLVWVEYEYLNIENAPYFVDRMIKLYFILMYTVLELDVRWRAARSMAAR